MTLVVTGYWPTTYWAEDYWTQDYWPEYGSGVPPAPTPVVTTQGYLVGPRRRRKRKVALTLLLVLRDYLEFKVKQQ